MKKIGIVIVILSVIFTSVVLTKNMIAKSLVTIGIKSFTGVTANIENIKVGIVATSVSINGLQLFNPPRFPDKLMVDIPELYVNYNLGALLKRKVHMEEAKLNVKEFVVVKNEKGELNIDSLKTVRTLRKEKAPQEKKEKATKREFQIDVLELKIGQVISKDYSQGIPPKVRQFTVNIDQRFENVTDLSALVKLGVVKALADTAVANFLNFDLGSLKEGVTGQVDRAIKVGEEVGAKAKDTAEKVLDETVDQLKKVLPLEK